METNNLTDNHLVLGYAPAHITTLKRLYGISSGQISRFYSQSGGPKLKKTPVASSFRFTSVNQRLESALAYLSVTEVREMLTQTDPSRLFLLLVLNVAVVGNSLPTQRKLGTQGHSMG